jgi:hypothetical protein
MNVTILSCHIRRTIAVFMVGSMLGLTGHFAEAQKADPKSPTSAQAPDNLDVNRIISQFTSGETELLAEFGRYGYRRDFDIQSLRNGKVVGEYHRVSQITLSSDGRQVEKILSLPAYSLDVALGPEDLENLSAPYQFPLQSVNASLYKFAYIGKERMSNLDFYVFDVKPVSISSQRRLFHGRIWVDVGSLRIAKTLGKFVEKGNQRFPVIEMNRVMVDNRFLFPATGTGDDELVFASGSRHVRITITNTDYVKLR